MLNISRKFHAATSSTAAKYELPEAEIIPSGNSSNEKRKLSNAKSKYNTVAEYDNIPLPGFTLYKTDRKNWGSTDQTWLVIDPRGFLVRISSQNLEKILHVTGITEGLIQEKCVWARENSATTMMLVPVTSKIYDEAVGNTELIEGRIEMKDVQIGDTVLLQNKLSGVYMGCLSLYGPISDYSKDNTYKPQTFLRRQIIEVEPGKFHYQTDLKILTVTKKAEAPWTKDEAAKYLNEQIANGAFFTNSTHMTGRYSSTHGRISFVSVNAVPKVTMKFEEITKPEAEVLFNEAKTTSDFGKLLMLRKNGTAYIVDFPYSSGSAAYASTNKTNFSVSQLVPTVLTATEKIQLKERRKSYWSPSTPVSNESLDNFEKFYKIVKCVKNDSYV